ncbi:MAG TPA: DUF5606 domain-containing protein [Cytophagaceae bacterium]|jgi:hypothetical protein|nr:DUF5606 domain-containing protein [Cytophagaceae bacterium]
MELLKEIASVSGKGGLFRILKPTRTGVILETIDEKKTKLVANSSERVSILKEISVYTTGEESAKPLEEVLMSVHKMFGNELTISSKSSDAELRAFMEKVVPDYDEEKVYCSDIKKLVNWYGILSKNFAELFVEDKKEIPAEKEILSNEVKASETEIISEKEKPKAKAKAKPKDKDSSEEVPEEKVKPKAATKSSKK